MSPRPPQNVAVTCASCGWEGDRALPVEGEGFSPCRRCGGLVKRCVRRLDLRRQAKARRELAEQS